MAAPVINKKDISVNPITPKIVQGTIIGRGNTPNLVRVWVKDRSRDDEITCEIIFPFSVKDNTSAITYEIDENGVVLLPDINSKTGYWLGAIWNVNSPFMDGDQSGPGSVSQQTKSGAALQLSGESGAAALRSREGEISVDTKSARMSMGGSYITIDDSISLGYRSTDRRIDSPLQCSIEMKKKGMELIADGNLELKAGGDIEFTLTSGGVFAVGGGPYDATTSKGASFFDIETSDVVFNTLASFRLNTSYFKAQLTSGKMGASDSISPVSPSETWDVSALMGDVVFSATSGDIKLSALNNAGLGNNMISFTVSTPLLNYGYIDVGGLQGIELFNMPVPGIYSSMLFSQGGIVSDSILSTEFWAGAGFTFDTPTTFSISSLLKTSIEGTAGVAIESNVTVDIGATIGISLEGKAMITMKTKLLDMSESKVINFGPKTPPPTGTGPLCAIKICPYSGAPHAGELCT